MNALLFHEFGGPYKLRYEDVPDPTIAPHEVLVRVKACALNHLDLFVREGIPTLKTPLPFWTGCDIAGEVVEVGAAAQGVKVGGGVSSTAVQIARLCGARVIVTSSSDAKLERAKTLGADVGINYKTNPQWTKAVFEATDKRGVDVVIENVGAATWKDSIRALKGGGRLVTCGSTSGPVGETLIPLVFWKQVHIIGSTMANRKEFNDVMRLFFQGRLKAIIDEVVPLKDGAAAQTRLAEGKQFGKIVLTP